MAFLALEVRTHGRNIPQSIQQHENPMQGMVQHALMITQNCCRFRAAHHRYRRKPRSRFPVFPDLAVRDHRHNSAP